MTYHRMRLHVLVLLVPAFLALAAASPRESVEDLVRLGNDAFAEKKFALAVELYEQAELRAVDPGLVAFNKASALYQLALASSANAERIAFFRQAELHYRCAGENAEGPRAVRARLGLGNSLVQGRPDNARALREAIACYRVCLGSTELDETGRDDVRHNLALARLKLLSLEAKKEDRPRDEKPDEPKKPDGKDDEPKKPMGQGDDPMKTNGTGRTVGDGTDVKDGQKGTPTDQRAPGKGKLKTVYDGSASLDLDASEAAKELEEAYQRILRQRQDRHSSSRNPKDGVRDW